MAQKENTIKATEKFLSKEQRLQKLLSGLGNDYTIVLLINLDTDKFEIVLNQASNNIAKQEKTLNYTDYLDNYANTFVVPESCEAMKRILRKDNLKEHFLTHDDLYFRFRSVPNSLGQTCFEAHAVREYDAGEHHVVIGFRCVDRIVAKELEYQHELDKAYKMARQQLDVITASLPGGLKISYDDPTYSFKYVSKQYAAMLGYTVEELFEASGGSIVGIAHPDDLEAGIREALAQYEKSDSYAITYRMRCKDGSYKYIEDHGHKVVNSDGVVEHWNLILDKDELVTKTIELESARKAEEAKTAFLSRMSHDIRTPLNGIIGLLDMLSVILMIWKLSVKTVKKRILQLIICFHWLTIFWNLTDWMKSISVYFTILLILLTCLRKLRQFLKCGLLKAASACIWMMNVLIYSTAMFTVVLCTLSKY